MSNNQAEKRSEQRKYFKVSDTGHVLEANLDGKEYQFKLLNICRGGAGILVKKDQAEALKSLIKGLSMKMNYVNPSGSLKINVEIRHTTVFKTGPYEGDYCVGFAMSVI